MIVQFQTAAAAAAALAQEAKGARASEETSDEPSAHESSTSRSN